jgi:hypothetical protein
MKFIKIAVNLHFVVCLFYQLIIITEKSGKIQAPMASSRQVALLREYCTVPFWDDTFHMFCPPPMGSHIILIRIGRTGKWFNPFEISRCNAATRNFFQRLDFGLTQNLLKEMKQVKFDKNKANSLASYFRLVYAGKKITQTYSPPGVRGTRYDMAELKVVITEIGNINDPDFNAMHGEIYLPSIIF